MKLRALKEPAELAAYDELARRHGTLFNRLDWLALFGPRMQAYGLFSDNGKMVGGLSLYWERRGIFRICRRAPYTPTCGPFLEMTAQKPVTMIEMRRKALGCMVDLLENESPAICLLPLDRGISEALPFFWHGYKVIPYYTYLLDLSVSLEEIFNNMASAQRNHIAKAQKDQLTVRRTEDLRIVRELVLATFRRQRKSLDEGMLDSILFRYCNGNNSFAFTTYRGECPIATCLIVHDHNTAYDLLAGYRAEERHHGAGPLAVCEAIRHAQALGLKTFDFEGSILPAIETYFRGFGGRLVPYLTVNKAWLPLEMALKCWKRNVF